MNRNMQVPDKIILTVFILFFTVPYAFCQTEHVKVVANNLALYKQKKDFKYLGVAKKAIDSVLKASPDSLDLERNVYKAMVDACILYNDTLNKLSQPPVLFNQTVSLVENLSARAKINRFSAEMDYAKQCLANVYIRKAFVYIHKSDFLNGLKLFQNAQNYAPSYKPLIGYIAYCNSKLGDLNTAAKLYTDLVADHDVKAEYVEEASNIYKQLGDTTMALNIVLKGRKFLPDDKSILLDEANIYNNNKDYKALYPLLPVLLNIYTNNADIAFVAANCYDHLNLFDKAETLYLRSIDLNSSAYEPIFNLGLFFLKQSENARTKDSGQDVLQAQKWLEKANEISPDDVKCLTALQMVYAKTGNNDELKKINIKLKQLTNQ